MPDLLEFCPFRTEIDRFEDEMFDTILAIQFSDKFVAGEEAPVKTPLKKKKIAPEPEEDESDEIFMKPAALPVRPKKLPVPSAGAISSNQSQVKNLSTNQNDEIEQEKLELKQRYSQCKVVDLRKMLDRESLPKNGKKVELVNRLVDQSLRSKYGSPRMRNSYQNAMAAPLSQSEIIQSDCASLSSLKSTTSTSSLRSTGSNRQPRTLSKMKSSTSSSRFR